VIGDFRGTGVPDPANADVITEPGTREQRVALSGNHDGLNSPSLAHGAEFERIVLEVTSLRDVLAA